MSLKLSSYINFYGLPKKGSLWFDKYNSASELTEDQRIFMSYHTERSLQDILGDNYVIYAKKIYLSEYMKAVEHFISTGEKKYFYEHGQLNGVANYGQYMTRKKQIINLQPYFFFNKTDTNLSFRVFNYGLNFINRARQPAPYSLRIGKAKQWKIYGNWYMMVLKPIPKTESLGKP